jgi:hypothetical protein
LKNGTLIDKMLWIADGKKDLKCRWVKDRENALVWRWERRFGLQMGKKI